MSLSHNPGPLFFTFLQPTGRGLFNWTGLDADIAKAQQRGQKVLFTLGSTPQWASSNPTQLGYMYNLKPGGSAPPASTQDWKDFITALARRYRGTIIAYEVWNEPNAQGEDGFYNGTPERLAELAIVAAEVLRVEDPSALLLAPPMSGTSAGALDFLLRFLRAGGASVVQGIASHSYNDPVDMDVDSMASLKSAVSSAGLASLPLWTTENGILPWVWNETYKNSSTGAAAFLAKSYVLNWAVGFDRYCW
jgi:hypothetical protein